MRLNNAEFKVFRELQKLEQEGKLTPEKAELLAKLRAKKDSNALEWWSKYPELLKDSVNIAFNYLAGKPMLDVVKSGVAYYQPGVMRIPYLQTLGVANDKTSPFNVQMYQLWLHMHRKYRGIGAYQMSDLGIALFSIIDAFGNIAEAERIYACANTYVATNRNVPFTILQSMNVDIDKVVAQMADFRYGINLLNRKLKALCLPKGLSMLENRTTLNTGVFKDADNDRSAIFYFDTEYYCVYEAATYTTGGSVNYRKHKTNGAGKRDVDTILDELTEQIDALLLDDDIARICSDIIAVFENDVESSTEMPEDYSLSISKIDERLIQLHNLSFMYFSEQASGDKVVPFLNRFSASIWAEVSGLTTPSEHYMDIYQQDNVVHSDLMPHQNCTGIVSDSTSSPFAYYSSTDNIPVFTGTPVFDCNEEKPGAETVMCGSRFTYIAEPRTVVVGGNGYTNAKFIAYGSELCYRPTIWKMIANGTVVRIENIRQWGNATGRQIASDILSDLNKFDWHPLLYKYSGSDNPATPNTIDRIHGDLDNFVALPANTLTRLHEVAILSGFKIEAITTMK